MVRKFRFIFFVFFLLCVLPVFSQELSPVWPKPGQTLPSAEVKFMWNPAKDAVSYNLEVYGDNEMNELLLEINTPDYFYDWSSLNTGDHFWRVQAVYSDSISDWINLKQFKIFTPSQISDLALWLAADSLVTISEGKVSEWGDLSGNDYHLLQNNPENQPELTENAINNYPSIHFNGTSDFMTVDFDQSYAHPNSFFVVWKTLSTGRRVILDDQTNLMLDINLGNEIRLFAGAGLSYTKESPFDFLITTAVFNEVNSKIFENSSIKVMGNTGNKELPGLSLGRRTIYSDRYFHGEVSEIIFFDKEINAENQLSIENYLKRKYNLGDYIEPVNLGIDYTSDYSLCPIILDAGEQYESYIWSTGETTSNINVQESGVYSVIVTDAFGHQSTDSIKVDFPVTKLNTGDNLICSGDSLLLFPDLPNFDNYIFQWNTGSEANSIFINEEGEYWVQITDDEGCVAISDTVYIEIDLFSESVSLGDDLELCSGNEIELIWETSNENLTYLWNNGETTSSIPVYESGIYSIAVTNENQCTGTDSLYVEIIGTAPEVIFSANTTCLGDVTEFENLTEPAEGDEIISWYWLFGDGNSSDLENPDYTYPEAGSYTASLEATSASGCSDNFELVIEVLPNPNAFFEIPDVCATFPVQFTDGSIIPENTEIIEWYWDFGDGTTSSDQNPQHTFSEAGLQEVTLQIILNNGCSDIFQNNIIVPDQAPVPENFSLVYPKQDQYIFEDTIEFSWNFPENYYAFELEIAEDEDMQSFIGSYNTYNQSFIIEKPSNKEIFWRVKAYNICRDTITSNTQKVNLFDPTVIEELTLWLAADSAVVFDEYNSVAQWKDLSSNNYDALQFNSLNQPKIIDNAINNLPSIQFDGVNHYMMINFNEEFSQPNSFFIVWKTNSSGQRVLLDDLTNVLVDINNGDDIRIFAGIGLQYPIQSPFDFLITTANFNTESSRIFENSILKTSGNVGNRNLPGLSIGRRSVFEDRYFHGEVSEIIFYNKNLNENERINIESYLKNKYNLGEIIEPVNLSFDRNITYGFCPVTLDAGERFEAYLWNTGEITQTIEVLEPGIYSVTVTDIFGFQSSDSVEVKFPSYGLNMSDVTVCLGTEVELSWEDGGRRTPNVELRTLNVERKDIPLAPFKGGIGSQELRASDFGLRTSEYTFIWNTGDTTQTITVTETGIYSLLVMDTLGCSREFTANVFVDDFEVSATLGEPRPFCMGDTLFVQSVWEPDQLIHVWNDGSTAPGLPIYEPGDYTVTVTNPNGCVAEATTSLTFQGNAPEVDFTATTPCFGEPSLFTGTSNVEGSEIITRMWYFGDPGDESATGSGEDVNYTYSQPGIFNATLQVESAAGCSSSKTLPVQVYHLPGSWFTPNNACTDIPVQFNDASQDVEGGIGQWQWNFYDIDGNLAGQSNEESPEFTFDTPGNAYVELLATSVVGCHDTIMREINIKESPSVDFSFTTPCLGEPVFFTDLTEASPWALVASQQWNFGDGQTSPQSNPSYLYQEPGIYDVTLSVIAINGCAPSLTKPVTVHSPPQTLFATPSLCEKTVHTFSDESTVENSFITQWYWDFDGQGSSTEQFPEFSFSEPGQYMVSLTTTSDAGCSNSITLPMDVYPAPEPAFSFFPRYGVAPLTVSFTNLTEGASLYSWEFGDGSNSTDQPNPVHTFTENGIYVTQLTAFSDLGCAGTESQEIKVIPLYIDVVVSDPRYVVKDGLLQVTTTISNLGTLEFDTLFLEYHISGSDPIRETWSGQLSPGMSTDYTFSAQLPWRESYTHFCVEAFIPRLSQDDNPENNRECFSFKDEFRLLPAFPNPAEGYVNIGFILPYSERVTITLSDIRGHTLTTLYDGNAQQGVTTLRIPIEEFTNGIYLYRVTFRDESKVGRFMKY
ncbi:MAG: PKD domain-containing protein [Bacteroidales bacterium]